MGLTPLERGLALHEILFEFFIHRRERGLQPLFTASDDEFREAAAELLSLAKRRSTNSTSPTSTGRSTKNLYWEPPGEKGCTG